MTTIDDVRRIIANEGLTKYRLFDAGHASPDEVGIRKTAGGLLVYTTDEREVELSAVEYTDESAAYDAFIERLRAGKRLDARRRERRASERDGR